MLRTATSLCVALAVGVLAGLVAKAKRGIWWLDPTGGLVMAFACVLAGCQNAGRRTGLGADRATFA